MREFEIEFKREFERAREREREIERGDWMGEESCTGTSA